MTEVRFLKSGHRHDYFLFALVVILTTAGLVILASASSDLGRIRFNDSYYYLKHQLLYGLSFGIAGFLVMAKVHYQYLRRAAFIMLLINIVLLALVFTTAGISAGGASRWLKLGPLAFQPSELLKLTFIIYLAAWLANPKVNRIQNLREGFIPFFIVSGILAVLLILQPATSTVVILLLTGLTIYFVSGVRLRYVASAVLIGLVGLGLVIWRTPYRFDRILTFLDPARDVQDTGYQINQALMTIGSGGFLGVGYGKSTSKVNYLPAPLDDSIFAVAAQELGFVGAGSLVVLFGTFVFRLLRIAQGLRDRFGRLILVGFATIVALQSLVNMAAVSGLIPLTGVPLPFISYGGTALAVFLTMSGIAVNISKYA
ncbi:MAG: Stage V sporulation protein E [Parcubacteria group bacterium GW2011_GWB1_56_8]|nr:MAG: Stage V sporulation protein E [Parcubacteria group bacterium GW2011_GWB1_56_8]